MLDTKTFAKKLKTVSLNMKAIHADLQDLAIFAIHQIYKKNTNQAVELLMALTKAITVTDKSTGQTLTERAYVSADAQRVMQFISDFSPVIIRPTKGEVKLSQTRLDNGMVEREESGYPMWYDWTKTPTPMQIKEVDGIGLLLSSVEGIMKRVHDGKLKITAESRTAFDKLVDAIEGVIKHEAEEMQKTAAKPAKAKPEVVPA